MWQPFLLGFASVGATNLGEVLKFDSLDNVATSLSINSFFSRQKRAAPAEIDGSVSDWQKHQEEFDYYRTFGYQCYSKSQQTYYKPGDTWFIERPFMPEITNGNLTTYYKCNCIGGNSGQYSCVPDEVPCYSNALNRAFGINEQWDWEKAVKFRNGVEIMDTYLCNCEGGKTGKYRCREKVEGCIDSKHNLRKYKVNEIFNQTRSDGLTYECSCNKGDNDEDRIIRCSLRNYCMYQNEAHSIGDTWTTYNDQTREPHMSCSCHRNPQNRNSNIVRCRYLPSTADRQAEEQRKAAAEQSRRQYQQRLQREKKRRQDQLRREREERNRRVAAQDRRRQEQEARRREFQERVRQAEARRLSLQRRRDEAAKARAAAANERRRQYEIKLNEREERRRAERNRQIEEQRIRDEKRQAEQEKERVRQAEVAAEEERLKQEEAAIAAREYLENLDKFNLPEDSNEDNFENLDGETDDYYSDSYDEEIYDDYSVEK